MKYAYHDLSPQQFEELIVVVCQRLLGISVQGFATGPDGGRDAKFTGTAELHPSTAAPWAGTVIIQAKHTNGYNKSFSETDFYTESHDSHVIGKEIPRVKSLRETHELDHYMLFSNRRLPAETSNRIQAHISTTCDIPKGSIYLCGVQQLDLWIKRFAEIAPLVDLDPLDSPLIVTSDELAEVVEAFARNRKDVSDTLDQPPVERVSYEEKNAGNRMTDAYAKTLRRRYLKDTAQIRSFLSDPENDALRQAYEIAVEEFELKIIAKRRDFDTFDIVMEYLVNLLYDRDAVLRQRTHKRLTRAMLFYMYFNCDIGKVEERATSK